MRRIEQLFPVRRDDGMFLTPSGERGFVRPSSFFAGSPWQMMRRMQEDMDRLFGQFFGATGGSGILPATAGDWSPNMDISENDREWLIEAELPGVNHEDIDVQVRDHHLILRAELRQPAEEHQGSEEGRRYHRRDRRYGFFERILPLPESVDEDAIGCTFRHGVLTVRVPKKQVAARTERRIPVTDTANLPAETAAGRMRSEKELAMTGAAATGKQNKRPSAMAGGNGHGPEGTPSGGKAGQSKKPGLRGKADQA